MRSLQTTGLYWGRKGDGSYERVWFQDLAAPGLRRCAFHSAGGSTAISNSVTSGSVPSRIAVTMSDASVVGLTMRLTELLSTPLLPCNLCQRFDTKRSGVQAALYDFGADLLA